MKAKIPKAQVRTAFRKTLNNKEINELRNQLKNTKEGTMLRVINPKEDAIWKKKAADLWREGEKVKPPTGKTIEYEKFKKGGSTKFKKK